MNSADILKISRIIIEIGVILFTIFNLIIIHPLYKFSNERTALFILFSKSCINTSYMFYTSCQYIIVQLPFGISAFPSFINTIANLLHMMSYNGSIFHAAVLAMNRFHAVFFVFSYQRFWNIKNIKYIIIAMVSFTTVYAIGVLNITDGFLAVVANGIVVPGDLPLLSSFCLSAIIYLAILIKFIYDYITKRNTTAQVQDATVVKDRLLVLSICLISTLPSPILFANILLRTTLVYNALNDSPYDLSIIFAIYYALYNLNFVLMQFIEEPCLLIMSKEFRKLVKNQFVRNTQTNVVATTVYIPQASQQQRMRQFNLQRHNLVSNN
uniref:7TM GPCR serpentine receptor class x (Srx) domain-containing protein n=1 Tax=Meloidogyne enterolobii TaxID=390850 RepID=A0A6V7UCN8_MELEN|nr:unnamed protein product [Meloidogyne enterolobii]